MNKLYFFLFVSLLTTSLAAQTFDEVSAGASYANTTFYNLQDGAVTSVAHTEWDISFGVSPQSGAIFVNEAVASSFAAPLPQTELYVTSSTDFTVVDTNGMERIYNKEISWEAGAFNEVASPMNPFDLGWGDYSPTNNQVSGTRIFVVKTRSEVYKKLEIQSLIQGTYTFRYADLDGANETTQTLTKTDYFGKTCAYFSFETEEILDLEPDNWDFMMTRYWTDLTDGDGNVLSYLVTGMLSNTNTLIAETDGIDPTTVSHADHGDYTNQIDVVGHDWKFFDLENFAWVMPEDLVYFVSTAQGELYQIQFIDFEGSSTGTTVVQKTFIFETSTEEPEELREITLSPNPTSDFLNIAFSANAGERDAEVVMFNNLGQTVLQQSFDAQAGQNNVYLNFNLPKGIYTVLVKVGKQTLTRKVLIG